MGFLRTLGKKVGGFVVDRKADKYSKPDEAAALATSLMEGSMSPKTRKWMEALLWALVGGLAAPVLDFISRGQLPPLHGPEGQALLHLSMTVGIMTFAAYWRQHPRPVDDLGAAPDADALVSAVLDAAQKGMLSRAHVVPLEDAALIAHRLSVPSPRPGTGPALLILLASLMGVTPAVHADQAAEPPPVRMTFGALGSFCVSDAGAKTVPGAFIRVEGPLVVGAASPLRLFAQADIMGLPGATQGPVLDQLETFSAARGSAGLLRDIGAMVAGGQDIRTAVVLHGGFATRIGSDPAPLDRYARSYGVGLQFEERYSGAYLRLEIGHDDAVAPELGRGHLLVSASIPVPHSSGVAALGADAALALGHPEGVTTTDRITFFLRVSPPK